MENYFSKNLKYLRRKNTVRQSDIAECVGKAPNTIGYWEAKKNEPDISDLIKVAQYFDIGIADFLFTDLENSASPNNGFELKGNVSATQILEDMQREMREIRSEMAAIQALITK